MKVFLNGYYRRRLLIVIEMIETLAILWSCAIILNSPLSVIQYMLYGHLPCARTMLGTRNIR